ncbi:MAG: COX15/CtaA family protein [Balneolaceae bacterium]|nr:COX15/CtaA family protein [Balneolaceae bacterium]
MDRSTKNRAVEIWLWSGAGLILLMVAIGGITRLTGSGLSMTDWNLLLGAIPPTDHAEWMKVFDRYKQFPEYQQLNTGMSLAEFKKIFFWEYLHRMIGRVIGLVFIVPFGWFWYRGYVSHSQLKKLFILFLLGASQGLMGWIMVKSGLVDVPYVSHYRLAAHLLLAFLLFGFCVWLALDWRRQNEDSPLPPASNGREMTWLHGIGILLILQVIWGAFVAGLNAGFIYNSFPLMNGSVMPVGAWVLEPLMLNFVENPGLVQWIHRVLGTVLGLAVLAYWMFALQSATDRKTQYHAFGLMMLVLLQYLLGVFTLIEQVPVVLGVLHQIMALLIWGAWIMLYHHKRECL